MWEFNLQTTIDNFQWLFKEIKAPSDWKKAHVVPVFTRKEIKSVWKGIDLFPYFQFATKFLSVLFIKNYSRFLLIISWFLLTSQDLDLMTNRLFATIHEIYKLFDDRLVRRFFYIYQRVLKYCMRDLWKSFKIFRWFSILS